MGVSLVFSFPFACVCMHAIIRVPLCMIRGSVFLSSVSSAVGTGLKSCLSDYYCVFLIPLSADSGTQLLCYPKQDNE